MAEETYLHDGVYASFDGWHIWLRCSRDGVEHRVALDPATFNALRMYEKSIWTAGPEEGADG